MASRPSALTHPRGRLPARVYWFRRGILLALGVGLVAGGAHLLGGGGDPGGAAQLVGSAPSPSPSAESTPSAVPGPQAPVLTDGTDTSGKKGKRAKNEKTSTPSATSTPTVQLAEPDGTCAADDVAATPLVSEAKAGGPIRVEVRLTATRPACTLEISPDSLAVKITSGSDRIWSSQDCPRSVPTSTVVVRSSTPATVPVTWNGRRSDGDCSAENAWAKPGYYHALAAVIGSEPGDVQFALSLPPRPVVTKTTHPKPEKKKTDKKAGKKADENQGTAQGKESRCGGDNAADSC